MAHRRSSNLGRMKAYPLDLRTKIVKAYDQKLGTQRELAQLFGVSRRFIEDLLRRRRETGSINPKPHAGGTRPRLGAESIAVVQQMLINQPQATLQELCSKLEAKTGVRVSKSTMGRAVAKLDTRYKRRVSTSLSERRKRLSDPAPASAVRQAGPGHGR